MDRVYASLGAKPSENSPKSRRYYVIALEGLRDRRDIVLVKLEKYYYTE